MENNWGCGFATMPKTTHDWECFFGIYLWWCGGWFMKLFLHIKGESPLITKQNENLADRLVVSPQFTEIQNHTFLVAFWPGIYCFFGYRWGTLVTRWDDSFRGDDAYQYDQRGEGPERKNLTWLYIVDFILSLSRLRIRFPLNIAKH